MGSRWYEHLLHNQSALFLKGKLLFREHTVVISVPYHVRSSDGQATPELDSRSGGAST